MKNFITTTSAFLFFVLLFSFNTKAQSASNINIRQYRITAYSKADNSVISQSNIATAVPPLSLYIPNSFTPNADGLNDNFGISGEGIGKFSMKIYNNWGELVFETNDINQKWDGSFHGKPAEEGVYVYMVSAKGINNVGSSYKNGTVTLLK